MKMKAHLIAVISLVTAGLSANLHASMAYNVDFFDSTGTALGVGKFLTEPATTICVETGFSPLANCDPSSKTNPPLFKSNPLTEFNAALSGKSWSRLNEKIWWAAEGQAPGEQQLGRGLTFSVTDNAWHFGGPTDGPGSAEQLDMTILKSAKDGGAGTWIQEAVQTVTLDDGTRGPMLVRTTGVWTANAAPVPVPAGWVLLMSILLPGYGGMCLLGKRRIHATHSDGCVLH